MGNGGPGNGFAETRRGGPYFGSSLRRRRGKALKGRRWRVSSTRVPYRPEENEKKGKVLRLPSKGMSLIWQTGFIGKKLVSLSKEAPLGPRLLQLVKGAYSDEGILKSREGGGGK